MAGSIGRIGGSSNFGIGGGFVPQQPKGEEPKAGEPEVIAQRNEVSPDAVLDFLANGVVAPQKPVVPGEVDKETEERIAGYMSRFDSIIKVIEDEFGPELAPIAMDLVMDKLF